jgi:hypothetical protein
MPNSVGLRSRIRTGLVNSFLPSGIGWVGLAPFQSGSVHANGQPIGLRSLTGSLGRSAGNVAASVT